MSPIHSLREIGVNLSDSGDKDNICHSLGSSPTYWEVAKHFDEYGLSVDSLLPTVPTRSPTGQPAEFENC
jgi:hypothetical protein